MVNPNRQMRSYLSAVILSAAMQADGFLCLTGPALGGGRSAGPALVPVSNLRQASALARPSRKCSAAAAASSSTSSFSRVSGGSMFELNASQYEEYMATRNKQAKGEAVAAEDNKEASLFESYMASREKQAALPPAEKEKSLFEEYMASRGLAVASPATSPAAGGAGGAAPSPTPVELSPYEAYMKSRNKVKAAEAATTSEEKEKASIVSSFLESSGMGEEDDAEAPKEEKAAKFVEFVGSRIKARLAPILQRLPGKHKMEKKEASSGGETHCHEAKVPLNGAEIDVDSRFKWSVDVDYTVEEKVAMFDDYMASRAKVEAASAEVTPEEVKTVSAYDEYLAARANKEAALQNMAPEEKKKSYFDDYLASRAQSGGGGGGGGSSASSATGEGHIGSGGMADTRNPDPVDHSDPRKSISAAPSFEEYLKSRA